MSAVDAGGSVEGVVAKLRRSVEQMKEAAFLEGVDPHGPFGIFVAAQGDVVMQQARMLEESERAITARLNAVDKASAAEIEKLRLGLHTLQAMADNAKQIAALGALKKDDIVAEMWRAHFPDMIQHLKKWLVLRETRFNFREKWRTAAIASVIMVMVGGGAYQLRAWQDEPATLALARCVTQKLSLSGPDRLRICYLETLLPTGPALPGWLSWLDRVHPVVKG